MTKNHIIIIVLLGVLLVGIGYFSFSEKETSFKQTVQQEEGILKLKNVGNGNLRIITAKTDYISVDLNGPKDELDKIRFFKTGSGTEFELSEEWKDVSGTITVPEGMLIDLDIPENTDNTNDDSVSHLIRLGGGSGGNSYNTITINDSGVSLDDGNNDEPNDEDEDSQEGDNQEDDNDTSTDSGDSGGNLPPDEDPGTPDDGNPPPAEDPGTPDDEGDEGDNEDTPPIVDPIFDDDPIGQESEVCSIKTRQEDRNDCCARVNVDTEHPICSYDGYWLFNYHTRLCFYHCFHPCNIGTQAEKDLCCVNQNYYSTTPGCIGDWVFDSLTFSCAYKCMDEDELEDYFGETDSNEYVDLISQACAAHTDQDMCCDYNLKNELSIGSRPGFPDCLGMWDFNDTNTKCEFRCSDYGEMLEILEQLEERRGE